MHQLILNQNDKQILSHMIRNYMSDIDIKNRTLTDRINMRHLVQQLEPESNIQDSTFGLSHNDVKNYYNNKMNQTKNFIKELSHPIAFWSDVGGSNRNMDLNDDLDTDITRFIKDNYKTAYHFAKQNNLAIDAFVAPNQTVTDDDAHGLSYTLSSAGNLRIISSTLNSTIELSHYLDTHPQNINNHVNQQNQNTYDAKGYGILVFA